MLAQRQFISGFWTSLDVALLATACGLLVTLPASFALTRSQFRGREALLQLLMSPLIVPAIVIGASLYMTFVEFEVLTGLPCRRLGLGAGSRAHPDHDSLEHPPDHRQPDRRRSLGRGGARRVLARRRWSQRSRSRCR